MNIQPNQASREISELRIAYRQAVSAGDQAAANRLYAKLATYTPAVLPVCPRCRNGSDCRCSTKPS